MRWRRRGGAAVQRARDGRVAVRRTESLFVRLLSDEKSTPPSKVDRGLVRRPSNGLLTLPLAPPVVDQEFQADGGVEGLIEILATMHSAPALSAKPRLAADVAGSLGEWGEAAGSGEVHAETGRGSKGERGSKWSKRDNSHRGNRLVAFLVEWMGLEEMRSGAGVLDVAGGAGLVTFELVFRRGVNTTCVDPRPLKLSSKQRHKMLWRRARQMQMPDAMVEDAALPSNFSATLSSHTARLGPWGWEEGAPEPPHGPPLGEGVEATARLKHLALYFDHSFGEDLADPQARGGGSGGVVQHGDCPLSERRAEVGRATGDRVGEAGAERAAGQTHKTHAGQTQDWDPVRLIRECSVVVYPSLETQNPTP